MLLLLLLPPSSLSTQTKRASDEASSLSLHSLHPLTKRGSPHLSLSSLPSSCGSSGRREKGLIYKFLLDSSFQSMEEDQNLALAETRKRKMPVAKDEEIFGEALLDGLNQDLLERVLSWLPASSFFRLRSVCKRWSSVAASATFRMACSQVPLRDPWFFMVDPHLDQSIVFDTTERNWKNLNYPNFLQQASNAKSIPVASSGGLVCFRSVSGDFIVCNPITGVCRELPLAGLDNESDNLHAIAMNSSLQDPSSYKLVLVAGEFPFLIVKTYDSAKNEWEADFALNRKVDNLPECDTSGNETVYFLSKAGDVVSTNMQRSPSKQYSSVITIKNGEEIVYFLSFSGTVVACNLAQKCFSEYPRLLPVFFEYSIDVVECGGDMLVVVLWEFLETASLRVWRFSEAGQAWTQIAAMPPAMSHEFYGKKADINCVGCGDRMLICVNSGELSSYIMCDVVLNDWVELPKCVINGKTMEFMSAFSFEPRVEACA